MPHSVFHFPSWIVGNFIELRHGCVDDGELEIEKARSHAGADAAKLSCLADVQSIPPEAAALARMRISSLYMCTNFWVSLVRGMYIFHFCPFACSFQFFRCANMKLLPSRLLRMCLYDLMFTCVSVFAKG